MLIVKPVHYLSTLPASHAAKTGGATISVSDLRVPQMRALWIFPSVDIRLSVMNLFSIKTKLLYLINNLCADYLFNLSIHSCTVTNSFFSIVSNLQAQHSARVSKYLNCSLYGIFGSHDTCV